MSEVHTSLENKQLAAKALRRGGWIAFWVQLVLVVSSTIILLFAFADPGFNISLKSIFRLVPTIAGLAFLAYGIYWSWHYVVLSKQLLSPVSHQHPSRASVTQALERGVSANLIGLLLILIAAQTVVTALLIKTLTTPAGIAIAQPGQLIDALDIFVVQACLFLVIAGVIGIAIPFRLLKQLHHYG